MKLGKKLLVAAAVLVVLLIGAFVALALTVDSLAKTGIEKGGTFALGVPTHLASADVGIMSGEFGMKGLSIENPKGFSRPEFFGLGEGKVAVSLGSLRQDVVRVPKMEFTGIRVDLERTSSGSNYNTILENVKRFENKDKPAAPKDEGKKFIIDEIVIRDVSVRADVIGIPGASPAVTIPIREVRLKNVGTAEGGATPAQIATVVVKAVLASAVEAGGGLIPADIAGELKGGLSQLQGLGEYGVEAIGQAGEVLKGIGGAAGEALQDVGKGVKDAAESVTGGLKNLLGGKR